jgi:hypothetical protein
MGLHVGHADQRADVFETDHGAVFNHFESRMSCSMSASNQVAVTADVAERHVGKVPEPARPHHVKAQFPLS